jgi:flagellar basal body-associated protein FliL
MKVLLGFLIVLAIVAGVAYYLVFIHVPKQLRSELDAIDEEAYQEFLEDAKLAE